jgi:DNA-binding NarL/FixJ family response regulator
MAAKTEEGAHVRILLIDDHDLFREGLKYLLPVLDDKVQFYEAGSVDEAMQLAMEAPVDLILLDYHMPGTSGLSALEKCRATFEGATVVVLSGEEDPKIIRQSIDQGASGYIPKSSSRDELVEALKVVLVGGTYLPRHALKPLIQMQSLDELQQQAGVNEVEITKLSRRQFEVLMKAIQGKSNKMIARELDISDHTVKAHLSVAFRTLGVQNRTEAVYAAAKLGIQPGQIISYEGVVGQ